MSDILRSLTKIIEQRKSESPNRSYVARLNEQGLDNMLRKISEEATETLLAMKDGDREQIVHEMADLWFHCLVALSATGVSLDQVLEELESRFGRSGLDEKASRGQRPE